MWENITVSLRFRGSVDIYRDVHNAAAPSIEAHNMSQYVLSSNIDSAPTSYKIAATLQPVCSLRKFQHSLIFQNEVKP
jgi:hypothetical protein